MEQLQQRSTAGERGALVGVALVGELVVIDRRRLVHWQHAVNEPAAAGLRVQASAHKRWRMTGSTAVAGLPT